MATDWKNPETEVVPRTETNVTLAMRDNDELNRSNFSGQDHPGGAVDLTSAPTHAHKFLEVAGKVVGRVKNAAGALVNMIVGYYLEEDLDCNLKQLKNHLLEGFDSGSVPGVADANHRRILCDQQRHVVHSYFGVGAGLRRRLSLASIEETVETVPYEGKLHGLAGGADEQTKDKIKSIRIDNPTEEVTFAVRVPRSYIAGTDPLFRFMMHLLGPQNANDKIRLDYEIRTLKMPGSEAASKAPETGTLEHDVTTFNAESSVHDVQLVLPNGATGNTIAGGELVLVTLKHNATSQQHSNGVGLFDPRLDCYTYKLGEAVA